MKKTKFVNPIGYTTDISTRPQCSVPNCNNLAVNASSKRGYYQWRQASWIKEQYPDASGMWCCSMCHNTYTAKRNGVNNVTELTAKRHGLTQSEYSSNIAKGVASRKGFVSVTEYRNSIHRYLKHRKDYCENIDGRLGFICNTVLPTQSMIDAAGLVDWKPKQFLEVDHIDGNHTHNDPANLQTLCKHCHVIKSYTNGDHLTPGRKTRDKTPNITNIYINDSTVNIQSKS